MSNYVVWYTDFKTGNLLGAVPALSFAASSELSGDERISVTVPLSFDPNVDSPVTIDTASAHSFNNFNTAATGIFITRDGVILFGGLLWAISAIDFFNETFRLDCYGFMSYLRRREIKNNLEFFAIDQNVIANTLVSAAVSGVAIETVSENHGVNRNRVYVGGERRNVGESYDELATAENGFDYYFTHALNGTTITSTLRTTYPAIGRSTELLVDMDLCSSMTLSIDGNYLVNSAEAISAAHNDINTIELVTNSAQTATRPQLDKSVFYYDITDRATLSAKAQRMIDRGSAPIVRASASLSPEIEPKLGSYLIGDRMRLRAKRGAADIDKTMRLTAHGLSVDTDGKEVQTLELVSGELFT